MKAATASICLIIFFVFDGASAAVAQSSAPQDMWMAATMQRIRDQSTLDPQIIPHAGYFEVYFNSEIGMANWADSGPPYGLHTGDTIRIHGYLVTPLVGGPYPAIVVGHGHGGHGSPELAAAVAALGYVALSIDGPMAGSSTGGPQDTEQAWISVEPSPDYSYLFHYAYAGMRALTLFQALAALPANPFRIDSQKLGVIGASMGGQFVYYINGVDDRIKGAVAIVAAGDWQRIIFYPGAWLYHGLYYYTRDGLMSKIDSPNAVTDVCTDSTFLTFLSHFDPIAYAPSQHGPLLTIIGTHDQYFTDPAINTTFERTGSAGTSSQFTQRILISPNAKHGLLDGDDLIETLPPYIATIGAWLNYSFRKGPAPPPTPSVSIASSSDQLVFTVRATPGSADILSVRLYAATQVDTLPAQPNDFLEVPVLPIGNGQFRGSVHVGDVPPDGPPFGADNVLYFAQVGDLAGYTVSSKLYYNSGELGFCDDFHPVIEHFPRDTFPVRPPPSPNCSCRAVINVGGIVNGASFAVSPAPVAPGSIAAIFGTNLNNGLTLPSSSLGLDGKLVSSLGGATVTVNNIPAPVFYSTPDQIGFQVPFELAGQSSGTLGVTLGGQTSDLQSFALSPQAPGIFTKSQDGRGIVAALHQDGATPITVDNPARPNEIITLFATGLGQVNPSMSTGVPSSTNRTPMTASVTVDGVGAEVQYSGTAPGFAGLNQVNVRIPAGTRAGSDIAVVLSLGARQSNLATIPVSF